jgi:hypothetical protein
MSVIRIPRWIRDPVFVRKSDAAQQAVRFTVRPVECCFDFRHHELFFFFGADGWMVLRFGVDFHITARDSA